MRARVAMTAEEGSPDRSHNPNYRAQPDRGGCAQPQNSPKRVGRAEGRSSNGTQVLITDSVGLGGAWRG